MEGRGFDVGCDIKLRQSATHFRRCFDGERDRHRASRIPCFGGARIGDSTGYGSRFASASASDNAHRDRPLPWRQPVARHLIRRESLPLLHSCVPLWQIAVIGACVFTRCHCMSCLTAPNMPVMTAQYDATSIYRRFAGSFTGKSAHLRPYCVLRLEL